MKDRHDSLFAAATQDWLKLLEVRSVKHSNISVHDLILKTLKTGEK